MKVLIVEDDEFKGRRIEQAVRSIQPGCELQLERSVNSGLRSIIDLRPDLVLLDMSLTTFDVGPSEPGGRPQNFGGMEILRQMERLNVTTPVIVITQHERFVTGGGEVHLSTIQAELNEQHSTVFKGLIYYNSASGSWERKLRFLINKTLKEKGERKSGRESIDRRRQ